jgi:glycosyltransferase involved in cell wall biosynthesis
MKLSVIIPAFNEEKTITEVLERLLDIADIYEVVVVNDCSTDMTAKKTKAIHDKRIKLVSHVHNLGKGAAIRTGLTEVTGDYVLIQDADNEYDPRDIPGLLEPINRGRANVVFGSRFYGVHTNMFYWHFLGNKFLNWVVNILYNTILSDMETGYKLIPTKLFGELKLTSNDFRIEPEITCKLLLRGVKIIEVPISYVGRTYAEGKKITWKDGFAALATIIGLRFGDSY